jgi:hypothetical protein
MAPREAQIFWETSMSAHHRWTYPLSVLSRPRHLEPR